MAKPKMVMALAKVLIAAAWADGKVSNEEINSLKDLLFRMPDMKARDWARLEIYLDSPVTETDRDQLVRDLQEALSRPSDKALAIAQLESLIAADGRVTDSERAVVEEIRSAIEAVDVSILGNLSRLIRGPVQRRAEDFSEPNREQFLEDFIRNPVFYGLQRRLEAKDTTLDIPEAEVRKLALAGGLMARVAGVDQDVGAGELEAMARAFQAGWQTSEEEAELVAEVAVTEVGRNMDFYRLGRQFFENTTEAERVRFLDVLFSVADGDGRVSHAEIEEIRTISKLLKMTHKQFIDAKLKIPRERRAS